jgi:hypothetical protein
MEIRKSLSNGVSKKQNSHHVAPSFSPATVEVAKRQLERFEKQADEDFIARAEIDRKLSSL